MNNNNVEVALCGNPLKETITPPNCLYCPLFSFFKAPITNIKPHSETTLRKVYNAIKGDYYKERTQKLRTILAAPSPLERAGGEVARKFKAANFDYCTFSGVFTTRNDKALVKHSGLLCLDFDHLNSIETLFNRLLQDDYFDTQLLFRSPSGDGLKWIISIDTKQATHGDYFAAIANYILQTYGVEVDKSGRDISRTCFLPHDPQAFINPQLNNSCNSQKLVSFVTLRITMSKKIFNPKDWTTPNNGTGVSNTPIVGANLRVCPQTTNPRVCPQSSPPSQSFQSDIETITQRIEATSTDIAPNYADWRDLGFALADALGESGRSYYHRLSCFYPKYNHTETDKQYNNCLKAHGHGVTIKTFYHLAKQVGIDVSIKKIPSVAPVSNVPQKTKSPKSPKSQNGDMGEMEDLEETERKPLPTIPETLYQNLPDFLQRATAKATTAGDRDMLLLGSLVAISPCLPNIYGIYAERNVYPNLFLFVTAQASAGKGRLTLCRKLVEPIHRALREQNKAENEEYQRRLTEYAMTKDKTDMERPQEPPLRRLIIPANNSATGLFQILNDNKGIGLIFETEGDTLAQTFKSEHGNYSDGFRKAFHHEIISYNRRKDREYVELETPRLSALLSGTPKQVSTLIPNAENGLFSRFIFYYMNILPVWKDVFTSDDSQTLDDYFHHLGNQFFDFYKTLQHQPAPLTLLPHGSTATGI